jgi:hypothetical protein
MYCCAPLTFICFQTFNVAILDRLLNGFQKTVQHLLTNCKWLLLFGKCTVLICAHNWADPEFQMDMDYAEPCTAQCSGSKDNRIPQSIPNPTLASVTLLPVAPEPAPAAILPLSGAFARRPARGKPPPPRSSTPQPPPLFFHAARPPPAPSPSPSQIS